MSGRLEVVHADVFTADLPRGEARLVYADPPYMHADEHGYGVWPGAAKLIRRMVDLGADDAAYVLFCGTHNLGEVLPAVEKHAPRRTRYYPGQPAWKMCSWVKPWRRGGRFPNVPFVTMWEPIVLWYGARYKNPVGLSDADWICALRDERSDNGHATQKPDDVLLWLFERVIAGAHERLAVDLFAGTGGAAIMAARMGLDAIAVEKDDVFCEKIAENAARPVEVPGYAEVVAVNRHGQPDWPTLGRIDLAADLHQAARQRKHPTVPAPRPHVQARTDEPVAGEVQPEPPPGPQKPHRRRSAHTAIVAAAGDV